MSNVPTWSTTAGSNNSSPPNGWPEGMQRSAVNDAAREMMAALAKWYQDSNGSLVTAGGTTAYTLTTNTVYTALSQIPLLSVRINVANTGASTLAVDGLTAKNLTRNGVALGSGDLAANQLVQVAYNPNQDRFEILGALGGQTPAGTSQPFYQASVPTGWSAVAQNNKALRVVTNGTTGGTAGGTTAFTSVFTSRTIAQANLPNVNFPNSLSVGTTISNGSGVPTGVSFTYSGTSGGSVFTVPGTCSLSTIALASGTVSGTVSSGGSGTAMDFAVQYVDIVIGTKN